MVSAACPLCKILVVEAQSASFVNLAAAEDTAARLGAEAVSNSYGAVESGFTQVHARHAGSLVHAVRHSSAVGASKPR